MEKPYFCAMNTVIETHAHIYDEDFDSDRDQMLSRAFENGIAEIWMPNCNSQTTNGMLKLAEQYPELMANDSERNKTWRNILGLFRTPFSSTVFVDRKSVV